MAGGDLPWRHPAADDLAIEHGQETLGIGGVAGFDDDIENQAAPAGGQVELVTVLHVAAALDHDVGVRLEQADQLLAGRHHQAVKDAPLALGQDALDQRLIVSDPSTPAGKAMFQMLGVFAEFERSMILQRVRAGIAKARAQGTRSGKAIGRPKVSDDKISAIRAALAAGNGIRKAAKLVGVGNETVHRIAREMREAA